MFPFVKSYNIIPHCCCQGLSEVEDINSVVTGSLLEIVSCANRELKHFYATSLPPKCVADRTTSFIVPVLSNQSLGYFDHSSSMLIKKTASGSQPHDISRPFVSGEK